MRIRFLIGILLFSVVFPSDVLSQRKVITDLASADIDLSLQKAEGHTETRFPILLRIKNTASVEFAITDKNASTFLMLRPTSLRPMQHSMLFADVSFRSLAASQPDSNRIILMPGESWEIKLDLEKLIWVDASASLSKAHRSVSPRGEMSLSLFLWPAGDLRDKDLLSVEGKFPKAFSSNSILIRF